MSIFLSHSCRDHDSPAYRSLCSKLRDESLPLWDEVSGLHLGEGLSEQLRNAIRDCHTCVFLATPNSVTSEWCAAELGAFWYANRKVIIYKADSSVETSDLPPQFHGNVHSDDLEHVVGEIRSAIVDAKKIPSFGMSLWEPFKTNKTMIVVPRISLRDSWNLNSEEIRLLLGPLRFLGLNEAGEDPIVRLSDSSYVDRHLIVLGAPPLDMVAWKSVSHQNDRRIHNELLRKLRRQLPDDCRFELYRTIARGKDEDGKDDRSQSGIRFGKDTDARTKEEDGKILKDVGIVARMDVNSKHKALWAFGFSAPGTRAALEARTQEKLSEIITRDSLKNFAALFEVEIAYGSDSKHENRAELSDVQFLEWQTLR